MKENGTSKLYNSITNVNDQFIEEAQTKTKKKKNGWIKWASIAACLVMIVAIGAHVLWQITDRIPFRRDDEVTDQEGEVMLATSNLNIYYLSENGAIKSKSVEVKCTPKDIFNEWAALNNISDVKFVACVYDDGGTEKAQGETIEYTIGNYYTLTLTLSPKFSEYSESENGDHLIESLRRTFYDYSYFDEFNLTIEESN